MRKYSGNNEILKVCNSYSSIIISIFDGQWILAIIFASLSFLSNLRSKQYAEYFVNTINRIGYL